MASDSVELGLKADGPNPNVYHVYPTWGRAHDLVGTACWCRPSFRMPCAQCEGGGCWNCEDGWLKTDMAMDAVIVVHNSEQGAMR